MTATVETEAAPAQPVSPTAQTPVVLVDHRHLPDEDGSVHNFQEHFQAELLTDCLAPRLAQLHPDGQRAVGHDCGIYWRLTDPPLDGCKAPDWFYVPGVPPMLDGEVRRSYVLWQEVIRPLVVMEFVSGDGSEERDRTAYKGKFWVYERAVCAPFYAIYEVEKELIELYRLDAGEYVQMAPNQAGRLPIAPLGVELGIWQGNYRDLDLPWMRFWDSATGQLLPTSADIATSERARADAAEQRSKKLADHLRSLGIDPDQIT